MAAQAPLACRTLHSGQQPTLLLGLRMLDAWHLASGLNAHWGAPHGRNRTRGRHAPTLAPTATAAGWLLGTVGAGSHKQSNLHSKRWAPTHRAPHLCPYQRHTPPPTANALGVCACARMYNSLGYTCVLLSVQSLPVRVGAMAVGLFPSCTCAFFSSTSALVAEPPIGQNSVV